MSHPQDDDLEAGPGDALADGEAHPEPNRARHRARRRRTGRGALVVVAVSAVVLAAGGVASLVEGDRPATADQALATPVGAATATAPPAPTTSVGAPTQASAPPTSTVAPATPTTAPATDAPVPGPAGAVAPSDAPAPVSLRVPAIDVDLSSLDSLGVADDGTIEVPEDPDDAGWLTASAAPGRTGPAVIAGHVDTRDGPAVFARLSELAPGDEVVVGLEDGTSVSYVVTGSETYPKTEFPTQRVYGPAPAPVLRLITCGGDFDRSVSSYEDNVVVYAVLAA